MKTNGEEKTFRIVKLRAENIKALTAVEIEPSGSVVKISGKNGAGKTCVLDSIWWALAGTKTHQDQPIRRGEKKAEIELDLGDLQVLRTFTEKKTELFVTNSSVSKFPLASPQAILDRLMGKLSFDPGAFFRMDEKAQYAELRKLVTLEVDIDVLTNNRNEIYKTRTEINRAAAALRAQVDAIQLAPDCPTEEVPAAALAAEMEKIRQHNAQNAERREALKELGREYQEAAKYAREARTRLEELQREIEDWKQDFAKWNKREAELLIKGQAEKAEVESLKDIDSAEVTRKIGEADARNVLARKFQKRAEVEGQWKEKSAQAESATAEIEAIDRRKKEVLEKATFPIPGLSLGDGKVLFGGLPIEQLSSAEQLRVSLGIAMAANPKLRVIRITDGSLLDSASMAEIEKMASERDYQIWIEVVDETGKIGVVISDGAVTAVNGVSTQQADLPLEVAK